MNQNEALDYVNSKGWEWKSRGDTEIVIKFCPFCLDDNFHLYMNTDVGLYHCKKCSEKGNLYALKNKMGDIHRVSTASKVYAYKPKNADPGSSDSYFDNLEEAPNYVDPVLVDKWNAALLKDNEVLRWLGDRGINLLSIDTFKLGVATGDELKALRIDGSLSVKWLAMPYFVKTKSGEFAYANVKFRTLPPADKTFRMIPDCAKPLYGQAWLNPTAGVYITEGELDDIKLMQEGWDNVVSIPTGAGSFSPENYDALMLNEKIFLMYDMDVAGRKGAREAALRLERGRCYDVRLPLKPPHKDITDYFLVGGTRDRLLDVILKTPKCGESEILNLDESLDRLLAFIGNGEEFSGYPFPWPSLTKKAGRMQPGRLIVLTASPAIGKSAFAMNIALDMAKNGAPSLIMCLEMTIPETMQRVVANVRDKSTEEVEDSDAGFARLELQGVPLYLSMPSAGSTVEKALDTMRYAAKRFGVKFIVFDNLHFLCRSIDHITQEIANVTKAMKLLAEELGTVIMLIVHPKKIHGKMPDMDDLKDSASPSQDADLILSLWRKKIQVSRDAGDNGHDDDDEAEDDDSNSYEPKTIVNILKSRFTAGGYTVLSFLGDRMRFVEYDKNMAAVEAQRTSVATATPAPTIPALPEKPKEEQVALFGSTV